MGKNPVITCLLKELTAGFKIGIFIGPAFIVLISAALAFTGILLFPLIGTEAFDPVKQFLDPKPVGQILLITYVLGTLWVALEALKAQHARKWRDRDGVGFLLFKARQLWAPLAESHEGQAPWPYNDPREITLSNRESSDIEDRLVAATGIASVARGLQ